MSYQFVVSNSKNYIYELTNFHSEQVFIMTLQILQMLCAIVSVQCKAAYFDVKETSGLGLTGCYQRIRLMPQPQYEKLEEPIIFLIRDEDCWKFSSDANASNVISKLRCLVMIESISNVYLFSLTVIVSFILNLLLEQWIG